MPRNRALLRAASASREQPDAQTRIHEEQLDAANQVFAEAVKQHEAEEAQRLEALKRARDEFEAKVADLENATRRQHADVDQLELRFKAGDPEAVGMYYAAVINSINFPFESPAGAPRVAFAPESRQLVIELELPPFEVVPDVRGYRYIRSRDELTPAALSVSERKRIYASAIAQIALAALRAAFQSADHGLIETVVLNGHVRTIDKRTGQQIHPCLLTVRATRERFDELNLALVDPGECLKGLSASISTSPAETYGAARDRAGHPAGVSGCTSSASRTASDASSARRLRSWT